MAKRFHSITLDFHKTYYIVKTRLITEIYHKKQKTLYETVFFAYEHINSSDNKMNKKA